MLQWNRTQKPARRTLTEATDWVDTLKSGETKHHAPFAEWLTRSRANVDAFLVTSAFDPELKRFLDRLPVDLREDERPSWSTPAHLPWAPRAAIAACICLVLAGGGWYVFGPEPPADIGEYSTRIGEHQRLDLPDGSTVYLNTRSRLTYRLTRKTRELMLLAGEGYFVVAKDAHRPFRVHADTAVVQAVGTRFNVDTHGGRLVVAVMEGKVQLAVSGPPRSGEPTRVTPLSAGESLEIRRAERGSDLHIRVAPPETLERRVAWMSGILHFENEPLSTVIEEMNRYNQQQLVIADPRIANLQVGGQFKAADLYNFLDSLGSIVPLKVEWPNPSRTGTEPIRLRAKPIAATLTPAVEPAESQNTREQTSRPPR